MRRTFLAVAWKLWTPWALWILVLVGLTSVAVVRWGRVSTEGERSRLGGLLGTSLGDVLGPVDTTSPFGAGDPFRLSKAPSMVRYAAVVDAQTQPLPSPSREPLPVLTLRAVAGGPPWQALIEGLPGQPRAVIVRSGNTFEQVTIRAIARDSVVVHSADSTWSLRFAGRS